MSGPGASEERPRTRTSEPEIPFRLALDPIVMEGRTAVGDLRRQGEAVAGSAVDDLLDGLAGDLGEILFPSLLEWFFRHPGRRFLDPGATAAHDDFVAWLAEGELRRRIEQRPLLARLVESARRRWSERARGVVEHAATDVALLQGQFGVHPPFVAARPLSDTGWRLIDPHGRSVIYKHRDLRMQSGLEGIVHWLNERGLSRDLRAAKTISRNGYGWTEDIVARSGDGEGDDRDYDVRIGMLAGLLHGLGGGDMHFGNICRSGAHPVVLDCEKVLRPLYPAETLNDAVVLLTGLLPVGHHPMHCGLATEHWVDRPRRVAHVGSDALRTVSTRRAVEDIHARFRGAVRANLERRIADLTCGFTEVYRLLRDRGLPLEALADAKAQVMVRFFGHYREILARLLEPDSLASATARDAILGSLVESPSAMGGFGDVRRAVEATEIRTLGRGLLPRFRTPATTCRLEHDDVLLGTPFPLSPIDKSHAILRTMNDETMVRGCREIAFSLSRLSHSPPGSADGGCWTVERTGATAAVR